MTSKVRVPPVAIAPLVEPAHPEHLPRPELPAGERFEHGISSELVAYLDQREEALLKKIQEKLRRGRSIYP